MMNAQLSVQYHCIAQSEHLYSFFPRPLAHPVCSTEIALPHPKRQKCWAPHIQVSCLTAAGKKWNPLTQIPPAPSMSHGPRLSADLPPWRLKEQRPFLQSRPQELKLWWPQSPRTLPRTANQSLPGEPSGTLYSGRRGTRAISAKWLCLRLIGSVVHQRTWPLGQLRTPTYRVGSLPVLKMWHFRSLGRFIERFRYGQPTNRRERGIHNGRSAQFWWLDHSFPHESGIPKEASATSGICVSKRKDAVMAGEYCVRTC